MDTRVSLFLLLDYKTYYGVDKTLDDAVELIRDIPSATLINYVSGFNANLYLHDNDDSTGKIQFQLVNSLLGKCDAKELEKWRNVVMQESSKGFMPIMFYNYSNLLFYNVIFENYNNKQTRDLTSDEAKSVFDAYLIINGIVNNKYNIDYETFQDEIKNGNVENVTITNFIYQRDYSSTLDFNNQINRGKAFFDYLENDVCYKNSIHDYYKIKHVKGWQRMYKAILFVIAKMRINENQRCQMVDLSYEIQNKLLDEQYLDTLCVNDKITDYSDDVSFKTLRETPLYKFDNYRYFVLDVNFLFDQFYKNQVFSFSAFLKQKGEKKDFLSDKGKHFVEETYLPKIINQCFPRYIRYYNDDCKDSHCEELCDAYIRENSKICIIECKDVLLKAEIKNSGDRKMLFDEFDKKFVKNEKGKQKGITQLFNAIIDINDNSISFDKDIPNGVLEIYPIVIYTDNSFGIDGLNKYYRKLFEKKIEATKIQVKVNPIVFINLSYFEMHCEYYSNNHLNIWNIIDKYHDYIKDEKYKLTPFEIYSRLYMNLFVPDDISLSNSFQKNFSLIMNS